MTFIRTLALFGALILLSAASAAAGAEPGRTTAFTVREVSYAFPLGAGFCLPEGQYETEARRTASVDDVNLTLVTFMDCAQQNAGEVLRYGILKAPKSRLDQTFDRAELLAQMAPLVQSGEADKAAQEGADAASRDGSIQKEYGEDVDVSTQMKFVGTDAYGLYQVGGFRVTRAGAERTGAAVAALTVIKGRMFFYYIYDSSEGADRARLLADVKRETARLVKANEP